MSQSQCCWSSSQTSYPSKALVSHYLANKLIGRELISKATGLAVPVFNILRMSAKYHIKHYPRFHEAILNFEEDYSRVTNPFAAIPLRESLDLHA